MPSGDHGKFRLVVGLVLSSLLGACAQPLRHDVLVHYQCPGDVRFEVVPVEPQDAVVLTRGEWSWELPRVASTAGSKFSNGSTTFLSQGDSALIELANGDSFADCQVMHDQ